MFLSYVDAILTFIYWRRELLLMIITAMQTVAS
jgi:hypothetical protein